VSIPARSPDLNPIESFFHLVRKAIVEDTKKKNITNETFKEFSDRVKNIMVNFDISTIDNIIGSMDRRVNAIIKAKGQRIKY